MEKMIQYFSRNPAHGPRKKDGVQLDLTVTELDKPKVEEIFKYLAESKFKIKYFLSKHEEQDIEVKPKVIFPLGPDDLTWNFASVKGHGLSFGFVFYGTYDYVFLTFEGPSVSSVKKAKSLIRVMKDLANLLNKYVEIISDKSQIRVASCEPSDGYLKFYPPIEYFDIKARVTKKNKKS